MGRWILLVALILLAVVFLMRAARGG